MTIDELLAALLQAKARLGGRQTITVAQLQANDRTVRMTGLRSTMVIESYITQGNMLILSNMDEKRLNKEFKDFL